MRFLILQVRDHANNIRHCSNLEISTAEKDDTIAAMDDLLSDKCLDRYATVARNNLDQV